MSAFKWSVTAQVNENIKALYKRLKMVSNLTISHEEFLALFVPMQHRETYRDMATLSDTGNSRRVGFKWGEADLAIRVNYLTDGNFPPPIPRDMVLQHDAPAELVERVVSWMNAAGNVSVDFGRVSALFAKLNEDLTKAQIRFVWPSIVALCNVNNVLSPLALELQDIKAVGGVSLPRGLLLSCRKTAATIALAGLVPADVTEREAGEVTIEVVTGQKCNEDGLGEFYGHRGD